VRWSPSSASSERADIAARGVRRLLAGLIAAGIVVVTAAGVTYIVASRAPAPVSVSHVIDRFRSASPGPTARSSAMGPAPAAGVYLYATTGSERVSAGDVTHTYPRTTTLSVTRGGCGLDVRWDALAGRWQEWHLCPVDGGWQLSSYVDAHKFLYLQDIHRYTCTGGAWSLSATTTVTCDTGTSRATSVTRRVGTEDLAVGSVRVRTTHLHVEQSSTGASTSTGSLDLWLAASTGLPVRARSSVEGAQRVLGQTVTYREAVTFSLTSLTRRR
jgi:hypothetical protein